MDSAPTISPFDVISANLRMILRGLLAVLGAWRLEPAMAIVLYRRVSRTIGRVERMLVRFRAGKSRQMVQRDVAEAKRVRGTPTVVLPRKFGWLVQKVGYQAAGFGCQLQAVLNTPDMVELLEASPQARRVLRPLCRALAVELPWVVGCAAAEPRERKPRVRKPRVKPEPFRIPLPRGLLSAARRQGFGKMR